jgi:hypothetical protein
MMRYRGYANMFPANIHLLKPAISTKAAIKNPKTLKG